MIPNALELLETWRARRAAAGHMLIALDFDGTIAPIVRRPEEAAMLEPARAAIEQLRLRHDTDVAFVSGRSLEDLRERCDIAEVYYAGNHGLQIEGPGVHETRPDALELMPRIERVHRELDRQLAEFAGVYLEDKTLTLSVHSRMIEDESERARVHEIVKRIFEQYGAGLKLTYGKRVVEVRPDTDWHKGDATLFLIERVRAARGARLFPMFIGDDLTDEDAFASLRGSGAGVFVGHEPPPDTSALAWLRSPEEVVTLLQKLAAA
jgi:trehalose 6-phosphate phosphatase